MATTSAPGLAARVQTLLNDGIVDLTIDAREHIAGLLEMFHCKNAARMRTCTLIVTHIQRTFLQFVFETVVSPQCQYKFWVPETLTNARTEHTSDFFDVS